MKGVDATNEFVLDTAVPVPPEPSTPIFYSKNKEARTERACISAQTRGERLNLGVSFSFFPLPRSISSLSFFLSSPLRHLLSRRSIVSILEPYSSERQRAEEKRREKREKVWK